MNNPELPTKVSGGSSVGVGPERLVDGRAGVLLRVLSIEQSCRVSLAQEGIVVGADISVERRLALGGPLIVRLGMTRIALARRVARDVCVARSDMNPPRPAR